MHTNWYGTTKKIQKNDHNVYSLLIEYNWNNANSFIELAATATAITDNNDKQTERNEKKYEKRRTHTNTHLKIRREHHDGKK